MVMVRHAVGKLIPHCLLLPAALRLVSTVHRNGAGCEQLLGHRRRQLRVALCLQSLVVGHGAIETVHQRLPCRVVG